MTRITSVNDSKKSIIHKSDNYSDNSSPNQNLANKNSMLELQQTIGNQAVKQLVASRKIQTKLSINNPSDIYELEADRVAEQVMDTSKFPAAATPIVPTRRIDEEINRKCKSCEDEEEKLKINRKMQSKDTYVSGMTEDLTSEIDTVKNGDGTPIDNSTLTFMQSRFGYDFSDVRVLTDERAARSAKSLNSLAYTIGNRIVFDTGKYDPNTIVGKRLLAHELTHVVQQLAAKMIGRGMVSEISMQSIQRQTASSNSNSDSSQSAPPIKEISVAVADGMSENDVIILIVATSKQRRETEKGSIDEEILARNLVALRSSLSRRCGQGDSGLKNKIKKPDLLMRISENSVVVVRAADVIYSAKTGSGLLSGVKNEPQASIPEPLTCEKIDQQAINTAFETIGGPAGEDILVHPGDNMYLLAEVTLMEQEGVPFETARDQAFLQLGIERKDKQNTENQQTKSSTDQNVVSVAAVAGALAKNKQSEPEMLGEGKICHCAAGNYYAGLNPPTIVDKNIAHIVGALKLTKGFYNKLYRRLPEEIIEVLAVRPDILDVGKLQIYEIKSTQSAAKALGEALFYIEILEEMKIPGLELTLGSPSNRGANGFTQAGSGWCVWISPAPGVIIYRYILAPENPRTALERLKNEVEGAAEVGVETVTGVALLGVAGAETIVVINYEALTQLLLKGGFAAGRRLLLTGGAAASMVPKAVAVTR
jgi:hypothetical protein